MPNAQDVLFFERLYRVTSYISWFDGIGLNSTRLLNSTGLDCGWIRLMAGKQGPTDGWRQREKEREGPLNQDEREGGQAGRQREREREIWHQVNSGNMKQGVKGSRDHRNFIFHHRSNELVANVRRQLLWLHIFLQIKSFWSGAYSKIDTPNPGALFIHFKRLMGFFSAQWFIP